ncbi:MAG: aspartyl/asparaginyl beta-hydroxylase domain-containing protein [Gammaproteobacteria bacterium]|nr:aspartyl/asparaginyl beta-hydroxylase domain-containing protein [Gammaproteobacteria bacterium]
MTSSTKPLSHRYPWQLDTRLHGLELTARLKQKFPADQLKAEFDTIIEHYAPQDQFGHYHHGGWTGVALHAIDGNPLDDQDNLKDSNVVLSKTPALQHAPLMEQIIDSLPCEKRRVRLLRLEPNREIFWHCEPWHTIDSRLLRLHVPIVTDDLVDFQISHEDLRWRPGELWYGDFSFPHRLHNRSNIERIHLVIDVETNDAIRKMLPKSLHMQRQARIRARKRCTSMFRYWNRFFATDANLISAQRIRRG